MRKQKDEEVVKFVKVSQVSEWQHRDSTINSNSGVCSLNHYRDEADQNDGESRNSQKRE